MRAAQLAALAVVATLAGALWPSCRPDAARYRTMARAALAALVARQTAPPVLADPLRSLDTWGVGLVESYLGYPPNQDNIISK